MAIIEQTDERREQLEHRARSLHQEAYDAWFAAAHYNCCISAGEPPGECGGGPLWDDDESCEPRRAIVGRELRDRLDDALDYIGHRGSRTFRARIVDALEHERVPRNRKHQRENLGLAPVSS